MKRKPHTPDEKAKLVIEVLKGECTLNEIAAENEIHPNMLTRWKKEAIEVLPTVFENDNAKKLKEQKANEAELEELYAQIGKLTTQNEWLKKNLVSEFTTLQRRNFVDFKDKELSVFQQAALLEINRSSLYYKPVAPSRDDLLIKMHIDKLYTAHPKFGYRRICAWLNHYDRITINHKAVLRHMREMGIQAVYPWQNTSKPNPANPIYPYLLKGLNINHPNHVWSIDITYVPIRSSWLYLIAVIDWYSRYVVDWMLDDTLDIGFVLETSHNALKTAIPEIMNSDQGSHFTSPRYTSIFQSAGAKISMDHRGRAYDNILIERLWRTVKYENIYPQEYDNPKEARIGISKYIKYYNHERLHQSLGYHTPEEFYYSNCSECTAKQELSRII